MFACQFFHWEIEPHPYQRCGKKTEIANKRREKKSRKKNLIEVRGVTE